MASNTSTPPAAVDLEETVWYGDGGECYHADAAFGPECPDAIPYTSEHSLREAREDGKRPCRQCQPTDHREDAGRVDSLTVTGGTGDD